MINNKIHALDVAFVGNSKTKRKVDCRLYNKTFMGYDFFDQRTATIYWGYSSYISIN